MSKIQSVQNAGILGFVSTTFRLLETLSSLICKTVQRQYDWTEKIIYLLGGETFQKSHILQPLASFLSGLPCI